MDVILISHIEQQISQSRPSRKIMLLELSLSLAGIYVLPLYSVTTISREDRMTEERDGDNWNRYKGETFNWF